MYHLSATSNGVVTKILPYTYTSKFISLHAHDKDSFTTDNLYTRGFYTFSDNKITSCIKLYLYKPSEERLVNVVTIGY